MKAGTRDGRRAGTKRESGREANEAAALGVHRIT